MAKPLTPEVQHPDGHITATDAWLLGALMPMIDLVGLSNQKLFDLDYRFEHQEFLQQLERDTRNAVLVDLVYRLYRGERAIIAQFQRDDPSNTQVDPLVYDLMIGLLSCRAAGNAGLMQPDEARRVMHNLGRRLQGLYASWKELLVDFAQIYSLHRTIVGQDEQETMSDMQSFQASATNMLQPAGIWQLVSWNLPLPIEGDADIEMARKEWLTSAIFYRHEAVLGNPSFTESPTNWCLAVAAIYRAWWGEPIDSLEPAEMMPIVLSRDWGVDDRASLLETVDGCLNDRHFGALVEMQRKDDELPQENPLAWDLVRLMQVATSGVCSGFVTLDEVLPVMVEAGKRLQATYGSWTEMVVGFNTGRAVWQQMREMDDEDVETENDDLEEVLELLVSDPRSPMMLLPWSLPLD